MLGLPVLGSKKAKVLTSNLLTCEWEVVFPWLSTGTELLMVSKGLGHLFFGGKKKNQSCGTTVWVGDALENPQSPHKRAEKFILPIMEKCPHRVLRCRVGKAIPYMQWECRIWWWLHNRNFHIHSFTQRWGQWKLVLRNEGCKWWI